MKQVIFHKLIYVYDFCFNSTVYFKQGNKYITNTINVVPSPQAMALRFQSSTHLLLLVYSIMNIGADKTDPRLFLAVCGKGQPDNLVSFYVNFATTMDLVYKNITISGYGIAVTGSDVPVYALGQCFNYLSSVDCQLCYGSSDTTGVARLCLPADGRMYLDGCFLRFSAHNFFNSAVDASDTSHCSNSSAATSNSTMFKDSVIKLMTNLTLGAGNSNEYYMAGSTVASAGLTVYGMAQCWRSLNASGCRACLKSGRARVIRCSPASDGKAFNAGCFVRYSTLPFYLESTRGTSGNLARRRLDVVLGVILGVLVIMGIAVFLIRRRVISVSGEGQDGSEEFIKSIVSSSLSFKYEDLKEATENFSDINKLGQGGFGAVYKGVLADGRVIAVKRLFFNTRQRLSEFFEEVNLVNQVQHKNLVMLQGCSVEGPESLLVYEYLCNNSLEKILYDPLKKNALDWGKRFEIIIGTAEGLGYLHSSSGVRIIHRDIKASNILLDERFKPKIADFGLARYFAEDQTHLSTGLAGTFGYMAPEYIIHGQLTEKADTYSYGILVIEIITGRKIQNSVSTSTEDHSLMSMVWQHFNTESLIKMLDDDLRGQCSEEEALKVFHVALLCTQASPALRPPMWKVVEMLASKSKELPIPTEPPFTNIRGADVYGEGSSVSDNPITVSTMQGR